VDCDPNKWFQPLENFIDLWITHKGYLDDVRIVSLPDDEAITWFTHSVRANPVLTHAIQQQENLKSVFLRSFPGKAFVQTLGNFLDNIRMTCVRYDNIQRKKPSRTSGSAPNNTRRANTARTGPEQDPAKKEAYEKYKEQLKAANLWIEPDTYNSWTPAQKKAHADQSQGPNADGKTDWQYARYLHVPPIPLDLNKDGTECLGRWAGVAEHVGDELTYIVVSNKTGHAKPLVDSKGMGSQQPIFLSFCDNEEATIYPFAPEELLGKVFHQEDADDNIVRVEIVCLLKQDALDTERRVRFLVESRNGSETAESVMEYNEACDIAEVQLHAMKHGTLSEGTRIFKSILAHDGPLSVKDPKYKGSMYNVLIEWDDAEPSWEPLNIIAKDDPVSCAMYSKANKLLDTKGWRWLKRHAKNLRKIYKRVYEVLKAKHGAKYKYGVRLPDREKSFNDLDKENGDTAWTDAIKLEIDLLGQFEEKPRR
jgi:hypothetical protein